MSHLVIDVMCGMAAAIPRLVPGYQGTYIGHSLVGIGCFGIASLVDRCCRAIFLKSFIAVPIPTSIGVVDAILEEVIYSILLQPKRISLPYGIDTVLRGTAVFFTGATAARAVCLWMGWSIQPNGGLSLDMKMAFLWMVFRELALRVLPRKVSSPSMIISNALIFGLAEVCPKKGETLLPMQACVYKVCSAAAFRLIAHAGRHFGGYISPFIQHILFNGSRYLKG